MKDIDHIRFLELRVSKLEKDIDEINKDILLETFIFLNELEEFYKSDNKFNLYNLILNKKDILFKLLDNVKNTKKE